MMGRTGRRPMVTAGAVHSLINGSQWRTQQNRTAQFRTESSTVSRSSQHFSIKVSSESQPPLISKTWGKQCDKFIWNFLMLWWFNLTALPNSDHCIALSWSDNILLFMGPRDVSPDVFCCCLYSPSFPCCQAEDWSLLVQQFCWIEVNPAATDPGPDLSQGQSIRSQLVCYSRRWK